MDDFVLNVKQIANYPPVDFALPSDWVLIQRGLGGPYFSCTAEGILGAGLQLGVNFPGLGINADFLSTPLGPTQGFNFFVGADFVPRYWVSNVAIQWGWDQCGFRVLVYPAGIEDQPLQPQFATTIITADLSGNMDLAQQLRVGRGPVLNNEVVSLEFLCKCAVPSFNGRVGPICLTNEDVMFATGNTPFDSIATCRMLQDTVIEQRVWTQHAIQNGFQCAPLVWSFNGRNGNVCLTTEDLNFLLSQPGIRAMTYPPDANDGEIATTAWVKNAIAGSIAGVASFNGRTGAVVLTLQDILDAGGAVAITVGPNPPNNPAIGQGWFDTTTNQFYVWNGSQWLNAGGGVTSFNGRTGAVTLTLQDIIDAGGATAAQLGNYVLKTGDTMTGALTFNRSSASVEVPVFGALGGLNRWAMVLGDSVTETGGNVGSELSFRRYADDGSLIDEVFSMRRQDAMVLVAYNMNCNGTITTNDITAQGNMQAFNGACATFAVAQGGITGKAWYTGQPYWFMALGDYPASGYPGTNFILYSYADDQVTTTNIMMCDRQTHVMVFPKDVTVQGTFSNPSSSDSRIKTVTADYTGGLADILRVYPIIYTYLGNETFGTEPPTGTAPYPSSPHYKQAVSQQQLVGFVAQDLADVWPDLVDQSEAYIYGNKVQDFASFDRVEVLNRMVMTLVNAVKELSTRVQALETPR